MQAVAYYVELLQYDIVDMTTVEPPFTVAQDDPSGSTAAPTTAGTNKMPVSTTPSTTVTTSAPTSAITTTTSSALPARPTAAHAPGYYAPIVAVPVPSPATDTSANAAGAGTNENKQENTSADVAAPVDVNRPQMGTLPLLSISNQQFFNWFLQGKEDRMSQQSGESSAHVYHR